MKILKKFFLNVVTKSIVLSILPSIYASMIPELILGRTLVKWQKDLFVFTFFLHIIALIAYGVVEQKQKNLVEKSEKNYNEVKTAKRILITVNKILTDTSNYIHELVSTKKAHSYIVDWHLMENMGDQVCEAAYRALEKVAEKGEEFSVSIMFKRVENNVHGYTMLSRMAHDNNSHRPKSYRGFVSEEDAEGSYYKKIFDSAPTSARILPTRAEIERNFVECNDVKFSQYIAIPITCKHNRMVGLLQIVAYDKSIIATNKKVLKALCNDYFSVFANLMLLCDKYENIKQIVE